MRKVTNSAGQAAVELFGTITTTANVLSTTINGLGRMAQELDMRTAERLKNVKHDLGVNGTRRRTEINLEFAESQRAMASKLAADPDLAKLFEDVCKNHPV